MQSEKFSLFITSFLVATIVISSAVSAQTDLVGHWKFDQIVGSTLYDESQYNNHGTLNNGDGDELVAGVVGSAIQLDGVDDYVEVPEDSSLDLSDEITISAWIKVYDFNSGYSTLKPNNFGMMKFGGVGQSGDYLLYLNLDSVPTAFQPTWTLQENAWYHFTATYDESQVVIYLNGGSLAGGYQQSWSESRQFGLGNGDGELLIGNSLTWHSNPYFNGVIDELRIYSRALSAAEVRDNYNSDLTQSFRLYGILMDDQLNPVDATVSIYDEGTENVVESAQTSEGGYDIELTMGTYDVKYALADPYFENFWVKISSINLISDIADLLSVITESPSENTISFNITTNQAESIETYSSANPLSVKVHGSPANEVGSLSQLVENTWFFDQSTNQLYIRSSAPPSQWECGQCNMDECMDECGGPCGFGGGDCDSNSECSGSMICDGSLGSEFGCGSGVGICVDCTSDSYCTSPEICCLSSQISSGYCTQSQKYQCISPAGCNQCEDNKCKDVCGGPCDLGEGDCDSNAECAGSLICQDAIGSEFGCGSGVGICIECNSDSYCTSPEICCLNSEISSGYCTQSQKYSCVSPAGCNQCEENACTDVCGGPCGFGEGDCDSNSECSGGMICQSSIGSDFGCSASVGICIECTYDSYCSVGDVCCLGSEISLGACTQDQKYRCVQPLGCNQCEDNMCKDICGGACDFGEGDCDSDSECAGSLICVNNIASNFGCPSYTSICVECVDDSFCTGGDVCCMNEELSNGLCVQSEKYTCIEPTVPCPNSPTSYPSDKWDMVWCDAGFTQKLADSPDELSANFDRNWGTGVVLQNPQRYDNVGFRAGRTISVPYATWYVFNISSDDGVRLWIDSSLKVDRWYNRNFNYNPDQVYIYLSSGTHTVRIDYFESSDQARVKFAYSKAITAENVLRCIMEKNGQIRTFTSCSVCKRQKYLFLQEDPPAPTSVYNNFLSNYACNDDNPDVCWQYSMTSWPSWRWPARDTRAYCPTPETTSTCTDKNICGRNNQCYRTISGCYILPYLSQWYECELTARPGYTYKYCNQVVI